MIISNNKVARIEAFASLAQKANDYLNVDSKKRSNYYLGQNAQKLEDDVLFALESVSEGTEFENTIIKVSGQKFPDIVADKYFGVEVKSSKDESWTTLGGSVNESTRVEDVERIFLTFGKLVNPIEFQTRPYEDCLSEVLVTHYPRYKINMNLAKGETIFDKMNTTYDELRNSENPVKDIVSYYKKQLKEGERLWWIDSDSELPKPIKVRMFRTLSAEEKRNFLLQGLAYFPNILGNNTTKYEDFSLWLAAEHGIVYPSTRDLFSAGGQGDIENITKVPRVLCKIYENREMIKSIIVNTPEKVLANLWKVNSIQKDRISQWKNLINNNAQSFVNISKYIELL